jgi:hypothetical protein
VTHNSTVQESSQLNAGHWVKYRSNILVGLILLVVVIPGNVAGIFDGMPLSNIPELFALLLVLSFSVSSEARDLVWRIINGIPHRICWAIFGLLVLIVPAKMFALTVIEENKSFDACYHSFVTSDDMLVPICEPFFASKFEGGRSRLDPTIQFRGQSYPFADLTSIGSNWNLAFVNNEQYAGRYGDFQQVRHPFSVNWRGTVTSSLVSGFIPITYVGEGFVEIDGVRTNLDPHYGNPVLVNVPISRGSHSFVLEYAFKSLLMKPEFEQVEPLGFYATILVGQVGTSEEISRTLLGWASDPRTNLPIEKVVIVDGDKNEVRYVGSTFDRADISAYFGSSAKSGGYGFRLDNVVSEENLRIVSIASDGAQFEIARFDGSAWQMETNVVDNQFIFSLDSVVPSLTSFVPLNADGPNFFSQILITIVDLLIGLVLAGLLAAMLYVKRKGFYLVSGLLVSIFVLEKYVGNFHGIGSDFNGAAGEGSALLLTSALVTCVFAVLSIFRNRSAYLSVGMVGSLYIAIDRVMNINPGMRWDSWVPVDGKSPVSNLGYTFFRPAASDWLIHAWNTRSSLFRGVLFGNEPVFYLQPGYRYFAPIFHIVFGDSDVILSIAVLFVLIMSMFLLINRMIKQKDSFLVKSKAAFLSVAGVMISSSWIMIFFIVVQTTEIPTWPFFLLAVFIGRAKRKNISGSVVPGLLLGLATCMRPNQVLGHFFFLLVILLSNSQSLILPKRIKKLIFGLMSMGMVSALPLIHNIYYGKRFVLFSTSRAGKSFDWSFFPEFVRHYLYIKAGPFQNIDLNPPNVMALPYGSSRTLTIGLALLFGIWIWTLGEKLIHGGRVFWSLLLLASPIVYLFPIIPYHAYFPRHAVVFWLAIFAVIVMNESEAQDSIS